MLTIFSLIYSVSYCGFPGYIENGQVSGLDYYYGDTVFHSCHDGFKLQGLKSQSCLGNGSWSGVRPSCTEIMCRIKEPFENGKMITSPRNTNEFLYRVGEAVKYQCDEGFTLDGPAKVQCRQDGSWSDNQPICQPVPCSLPPM